MAEQCRKRAAMCGSRVETVSGGKKSMCECNMSEFVCI